MTRLARAALACLLLAGAAPLVAQDSLAVAARREAAAGRHAAAASLYERALAAAPDDQGLLGEYADALEASGRWRDAIPALERLVRARPDDGRRLRQLGQFLAWTGDRDRALDLLRRAAARQPDDPGTLAALGELLSWIPERRDEAARVFDRTLALDPDNRRAREGRANLLAWGGRAAEALEAFDALLAAEPASVGALRGKGSALNQLRRHREAAMVLRRALAIDPRDVGALQELAQAEAGLARFGAADSALRLLPDVRSPSLDRLRDTTRRALGTYVEVEGLGRDRQDQLDAGEARLRLSGLVRPDLRVTGSARVTQYDPAGSGMGLGATGLGVGAEYRRDRVTAEAGLESRWVDETDGTGWDLGLRAGWQAADHLRVEAGWSSALLEETRRSMVLGARSSLAHVGAALVEHPSGVDGEVRLLAGRYSADGLPANDRTGVDLRVGYALRGHAPWLRASYGFLATGFDFSASESAPAAPSRVGGYFSPAAWRMHYGSLGASHRFGRAFWEFDGRLGAQTVEEVAGTPADTRLAITVNTHLTVRLAPRLDADLAYRYADAFSAFRMHELRLVLRQYLTR